MKHTNRISELVGLSRHVLQATVNEQFVANKYEKIPTEIHTSSDDASAAVASEIATLIRQKGHEGKQCVLGLATGSTPKGVYRELVRMHHEENLDFSHVVTFNLDEYYPMDPESRHSYRYFMDYHLFNHINIPRKNIHIPDGTVKKEDLVHYCNEYERKIKDAGGLDLQLLGIGRTGHIGFNEPGSQLNSITRLITLDALTRLDAAGDFGGLEKVPKQALTMGIASIMNASRIIILALGGKKASIVKDAIEGMITEKVPSTYLQRHTNVRFVLDAPAATELTRVKTPWLVDSCPWDRRMMRRAVVWLCQKLNKPILKLTSRDYNENGLSELIAEKGLAYDINIKVFNDLQHTITGWPGGKPNADDTYRPERKEPGQKRVLVFSPHPDDDSIAMGGTLHRLVSQNHQVHIAYQTPGYMGVNDDYAFRYISFLRSFLEIYEPDNQTSMKKYNELRDFLENRGKDALDSEDLLRVKALIRRGEARSSCRFLGIRSKNIHFMDMPFYNTGRVEKTPLSDKDIQQMVDMMRAVKPHQIFASGDLNDPHRTHRISLDALVHALDVVAKDDWMKDCYVWLYQGAGEWNIDQIDMAVPISPEELDIKRLAMLKHQTQLHRTLLQQNPDKEFWQQEEERNRSTADLYDQVGMAEYEAIESFLRYWP